MQAVADATGFSKTGLLRRFPSKDALVGLVDLALVHPGWAQVVLASIPPVDDDHLRAGLTEIGGLVSDLFRVGEDTELGRRARVTGMLGALVTLALTHQEVTTAHEARPLILNVCWATLGYLPSDEHPSRR